MVRINHLGNCALCHPPSLARTDFVRGAVPTPGQPLPPPTASQYYDNGTIFVRADTTYLRHEMLHHILEVAGWRPRTLKPGERYTIADLHPMPLFGLCTGGR